MQQNQLLGQTAFYNNKSCGFFISGRFTSCLDVQQKLQAKEDKEYTLQIMGINVSIYCYGMSTYSPQEYLSLPAGEDENFSEIYDRRYVCTLCTGYGRDQRKKTEILVLCILLKYKYCGALI